MRSSGSQPEPPKTLRQFVGGPPPGFGSAHRYQSRFGLSRDDRDSSEPGMLPGGVVRDEVEEDLDAGAMGGLDQAVEVLERAEDRVDIAVVADVVAEVGHR